MSKLKRIPRKQIQKWIDALRSGKYEQAVGMLQNDRGYCCLGVACEIFIPENKKRRNYRGNLVGGMPDDQVHAPMWLKKINLDFFKRAAVRTSKDASGYGQRTGLTNLNDTYVHSFSEIADILQAVYIEGVMDE